MSLEPEVVITQRLFARLQEEDCLRPGDRESVAYRIAEVMVLAKQLYLDTLPRLMGESQESMFDELAGLRMALLNFRDLVSEFDEAFLEAMHHQREADPQSEPDTEFDQEEEDEDHPEPQNGSSGA